MNKLKLAIACLLLIWLNNPGFSQISKDSYLKIHLNGDSVSSLNKLYWDNYVRDLQKWGALVQSGTETSANFPKPSTPFPPDIADIEIKVNSQNTKDSIRIEISVHKIDIPTPVYNTEINQEQKGASIKIELKSTRDDYRPEPRPRFGPPPPMNEGPNDKPFPPNDRKNRRNLRTKRMNNTMPLVVSNSTFGFGLLSLRSEKQPINYQIFNAMPELDPANTFQISFSYQKGRRLFKNSKFRFWYGLEYDIQNYRFLDPEVRIDRNSDVFHWTIADPSMNHEMSDKSKFVTNYLGIPLALGWQNKKSKPTFQIKFGIEPSMLVRAHTKVRDVNGEKHKNFGEFNLNPYAISPFLNIQFKQFGFYVKPTRTTIFRKQDFSQSGYLNVERNFAFGMTLTFKS